jgi:hypothetical protein
MRTSDLSPMPVDKFSTVTSLAYPVGIAVDKQWINTGICPHCCG